MQIDNREHLSRREEASRAGTAEDHRFQIAVEFAPNATIMVNEAGLILLVNAQAEQAFGYSRAELVGQPVEMLVPERFRRAYGRARADFFTDPMAQPVGAMRDFYCLKKDGTEFPAEIRLNPIATDTGIIVLSAIVDVTERKQAELLLRDSEQRSRSLAAIVHFSDDAIISTGLDTMVTSWNAAAERTFGYTAAEIIGRSVLQLALPGRESDMLHVLDRIKRGERVQHYETKRRHKNGSILEISLSESPIYGLDSRLIGASEVARDITTAKRTENELRQSQMRLQELHAELLHVSRLSSMGQMAVTMAHELNQPLSAIVNYMEAIGALIDRGCELPAAQLRTIVGRAAEQAIRAGRILQRSREFVTRGDTERRFERISPLIREARELALIGTQQKGISISLGVLPDVAVIVDKIQIQQVLLNLLRNAIDAVADQDDRNIALTAEVQGGTVRISVADNGPGIAEQIRTRLFQPFVSTKKTGMGMGLSICKTIMESHDGYLWAEPNPGGGAVFRLVLPLASVAEAE
jgi:two-component system sensor kinase FixL